MKKNNNSVFGVSREFIVDGISEDIMSEIDTTDSVGAVNDIILDRMAKKTLAGYLQITEGRNRLPNDEEIGIFASIAEEGFIQGWDEAKVRDLSYIKDFVIQTDHLLDMHSRIFKMRLLKLIENAGHGSYLAYRSEKSFRPPDFKIGYHSWNWDQFEKELGEYIECFLDKSIELKHLATFCATKIDEGVFFHHYTENDIQIFKDLCAGALRTFLNTYEFADHEEIEVEIIKFLVLIEGSANPNRIQNDSPTNLENENEKDF